MKTDSIYIHHFTPVLNALCQRYKQVDFDDILDAVHDAFEASLSFEGQILQPGAWLYRVAERKLLHFLRKRNIPHLPPDPSGHKADEDDVTLTLLNFLLNIETKDRNRLALALFYVGGLSRKEIASALKIQPENVKKILQRSTSILRESYNRDLAPKVPKASSQLLQFLYLLFNEGYKGTDAKEALSEHMCFVAIKYAQYIEPNPETYALLALMHFHLARFPARINKGVFVPLPEQDRTLYDKPLIQQGYFYLRQAGRCTHHYFLLALISAIHSSSPTFADTDWQKITVLYSKIKHLSHELQLNYYIAKSHISDPEECLDFILTFPPSLSSISAAAYLYERLRNYLSAISKYKEASNYTENPADLRFFEKKILYLNEKINPTLLNNKL